MLICKLRKKSSRSVEVPDTEEKARDEDINVGYADVTYDELLEELVMVIVECSIVTPVCD